MAAIEVVAAAKVVAMVAGKGGVVVWLVMVDEDGVSVGEMKISFMKIFIVMILILMVVITPHKNKSIYQSDDHLQHEEHHNEKLLEQDLQCFE
nr:hypothetical protein [Tanacetum cinerariifolium]